MKYQMQETDDVARHYSDISESYEAWYSASWPEPVFQQGLALHKMLEKSGFSGPQRILDLTCGIGTQSIGLARYGHHVTGIDLSHGQLERAKKEALVLSPDNEILWIEGNSTHPMDHVKGPFDIILSCGNSLPLLGTIDNVISCMKESLSLLKEGGLLMISMRDHTSLKSAQPYLVESGPLETETQKGIWIETAEWLDDGERYISHIIFAWTEPKHRHVHYPFPPLVAFGKQQFLKLLQECGFSQANFYEPHENLFAYPLFTARK